MENSNSQYDPMFEAGIEAQLEKMIKNNHKKGWDDIDIRYAHSKIIDNQLKLPELLYNRHFENPVSNSEIDCESVRKIAANIANFAHMIILKCDNIIKDKP